MQIPTGAVELLAGGTTFDWWLSVACTNSLHANYCGADTLASSLCATSLAGVTLWNSWNGVSSSHDGIHFAA